eukprot:6214695-Pleurochrysis_carterae.AAC.1
MAAAILPPQPTPHPMIQTATTLSAVPEHGSTVQDSAPSSSAAHSIALLLPNVRAPSLHPRCASLLTPHVKARRRAILWR